MARHKIDPRQMDLFAMLDAPAPFVPVITQPINHGDNKLKVEVYTHRLENGKWDAKWRYVFSCRSPGLKPLHDGGRLDKTVEFCTEEDAIRAAASEMAASIRACSDAEVRSYNFRDTPLAAIERELRYLDSLCDDPGPAAETSAAPISAPVAKKTIKSDKKAKSSASMIPTAKASTAPKEIVRLYMADEFHKRYGDFPDCWNHLGEEEVIHFGKPGYSKSEFRVDIRVAPGDDGSWWQGYDIWHGTGGSCAFPLKKIAYATRSEAVSACASEIIGRIKKFPEYCKIDADKREKALDWLKSQAA